MKHPLNLWRGGLPSFRAEGFEAFFPAVDVEDLDDRYMISMDIPGTAKEDVKIELADRELMVSGERRATRKEGSNKKAPYIVERFYGEFRRSFTLPSNADGGKIEASFKDGVLTICVPKTDAGVKARPIEVH